MDIMDCIKSWQHQIDTLKIQLFAVVVGDRRPGQARHNLRDGFSAKQLRAALSYFLRGEPKPGTASLACIDNLSDGGFRVPLKQHALAWSNLER